MSAYMIKKEVVNFLTNMDEDRYSGLVSSVQKAKGGTNIDINALEDIFVKHLRSDAASLMAGLESEVTTYYDSEYFESEDDSLSAWMDVPISSDDDEDDWYDGDNVEF